jgi:hypothetical protein
LAKDGRRARSAPIALGALSAICFVLYCVVPPNMNGNFFFAERFPILWVLFLLAAAAASHPPRNRSVAAGAVGACVTLLVLSVQWAQISRIGAQLAPALNSPPAAAGSIGLIVGPQRSLPEGLSFNPYVWGGTHYFRRSRAILANEPWLNSLLIMLRPIHANPWSQLDPDGANPLLVTSMTGGAPVRAPDFVLQQGPPDFDTDGLMRRNGWTLSGPGSEFLRIYRRKP